MSAPRWTLAAAKTPYYSSPLDQPVTDRKPVGELNLGDEVEALEFRRENGGWLHFRKNGLSGWIASSQAVLSDEFRKKITGGLPWKESCLLLKPENFPRNLDYFPADFRSGFIGMPGGDFRLEFHRDGSFILRTGQTGNRQSWEGHWEIQQSRLMIDLVETVDFCPPNSPASCHRAALQAYGKTSATFEIEMELVLNAQNTFNGQLQVRDLLVMPGKRAWDPAAGLDLTEKFSRDMGCMHPLVE